MKHSFSRSFDSMQYECRASRALGHSFILFWKAVLGVAFLDLATGKVPLDLGIDIIEIFYSSLPDRSDWNELRSTDHCARSRRHQDQQSLPFLDFQLSSKDVRFCNIPFWILARYMPLSTACALQLYFVFIRGYMPSKQTVARARKDKAQGKAPTTQAGEFVNEEIEHIRQGKHGARSVKQAIAIGLSKARRAGVRLKPSGRVKEKARKQAEKDYKMGQGKRKARAPSRKRSQATLDALKREGRRAASHRALSRHARQTTHKKAA